MTDPGRLSQLEDAIGERRLLWFGIRGEDALPLLALRQFDGSFAVSARAPVASLDVNMTLEELRGERVDLDRHDIDDDDGDDVQVLRREVLDAVARPSVVLSYRPTMFMSSLHFAHRDTCLHASMFHERQRAFDHKPWVETELAARGVPTLPWEYVADEDRFDVLRKLARGPVVLRASRSNGGVGIELLTDASEIEVQWPRRREALVSVAPYFGDARPVNVTACIFPDGELSIHPPSVQLVGIDLATDRRFFGYCGNDFGAMRQFEARQLDSIEQVVRGTGAWLHENNYLGVFGVDLLVDDDHARLTEVNPRFQGSSMMSAQIAAALDVPDLFLDHIAAFLDVPAAPTKVGIRDWVADQPDLAQLVCHNLAAVPVTMRPVETIYDLGRIDLLPEPDIRVLPGAVTGRLVFDRCVTDSGLTIDAAARTRTESFVGQFASVGGEGVVG